MRDSDARRWFLDHEEEWDEQHEGLMGLKARLMTAVETKRETDRLTHAAEQFAEDAERLARLRREMVDGKPVENMATSDIKFLLGDEDKKKLWNAYGSTRRQRWFKAAEAMPSPPSDASEHVRESYKRLLAKVHKAKQETVRGLPRQAGKWYVELARRELIKRVANHVRVCSRHCRADEWSFILDFPTPLDDGVVWDPAGNVKHSKAEPVEGEDD